jgi:ribosomal protein L17
VAKKSKTKVARRAYTKANVRELKAHSKARTPLAKISKLTKRTERLITSEGAKTRYRLGHQRQINSAQRLWQVSLFSDQCISGENSHKM